MDKLNNYISEEQLKIIKSTAIGELYKVASLGHIFYYGIKNETIPLSLILEGIRINTYWSIIVVDESIVRYEGHCYKLKIYDNGGEVYYDEDAYSPKYVTDLLSVERIVEILDDIDRREGITLYAKVKHSQDKYLNRPVKENKEKMENYSNYFENKKALPRIEHVEWNVLKKDRITKDGKVWASAGNICTVVFWADDTVTSVICSDEDEFNVWTGVITAIAKKGGYYQDIHRYERLFEKEYREKLFPSESPVTNAKHGHAGQKYVMDDTGSVKRVGRPRKSNKSK